MTNDTKTLDICAMDLAGEVPPPVNKAALRAARFRERNGVAAMTVNIDAQVLADFNEYMLTRPEGTKKGDVIAKLIKSQLLRKR